MPFVYVAGNVLFVVCGVIVCVLIVVDPYCLVVGCQLLCVVTGCCMCF